MEDWKITYRKKVNTLALWIDGREHYEVDLDECTTSAAVLDKIVQIAKKGWAPPALVGALVRELDQNLNLQGSYCHCGSDAPRKTTEEIREIVLRNRTRREVRKEVRKERPSREDWEDWPFESFSAAEIAAEYEEVERRVAARLSRRPRR